MPTLLPEPWLDEKGQYFETEKLKEAFVSFSVGPRKCVGLNLAMMELVKVAAASSLRFQGVGVDESVEEKVKEIFDCFSASPRNGRLVLELKS